MPCALTVGNAFGCSCALLLADATLQCNVGEERRQNFSNGWRPLVKPVLKLIYNIGASILIRRASAFTRCDATWRKFILRSVSPTHCQRLRTSRYACDVPLFSRFELPDIVQPVAFRPVIISSKALISAHDENFNSGRREAMRRRWQVEFRP
jgi:hypothetical protein